MLAVDVLPGLDRSEGNRPAWPPHRQAHQAAHWNIGLQEIPLVPNRGNGNSHEERGRSAPPLWFKCQ
jgi:hypothetical protein